MTDYVWTISGPVAGYTAVAGADTPEEVENLPSRALQRLLDRGYISLKPPAAQEVDTSALATDAELAAAQAGDDTRLDALEAAPAGEASPFTDTGVVISADDTQASWVVGSDRMNRDAADGTKDKRTFFNKIKGAFRAGETFNDAWDDANVGANSVALGYSTKASGSFSTAMGNRSVASASEATAEGYSTTASGTRSHAEGDSTTASGTSSHAEGGNTVAAGNYSHAQGRYSAAPRQSQASQGSMAFATVGDAQSASMVLCNVTADGTPTLLTSSGNAVVGLVGSTANVLTLLASRSFKVKIDVVARRTDVAGEAAGWSFEGVIARDATGNARFVGSLDGKAWGDASASTWDLTPSINTTDATNNYLALTATGQAAKTIRWVASLNWVEVG